MSTEETRHIVAGYVAALQRGDIDALRSSFSPKATWTIRGDIPLAGTWTGPGEILDGFLARLTATLDPDSPVTQHLHRIIADGDCAAAEWTSHARARNGSRTTMTTPSSSTSPEVSSTLSPSTAIPPT